MRTSSWTVAVVGTVAAVALLASAGCGSDESVTAGGPDPGENVAASGPTGGSDPGGSGGGAATCVPEPEELCDGRDNNCDGTVDEACNCLADMQRACFSGDEALVGIGECKQGRETCDLHGSYGACENEVLPVEEKCDGKDDDCDGQVDDGLGQTFCGVGICQKAVSACKVGQANDCVEGLPAAQELCNGVDDDCDGDVDEGCGCANGQTQACYTGSSQTRGVGACAEGVQLCSGGAWSACEGSVEPSNELCNGLDDNCNGDVDDNPAVHGGAC